MRGSRNKEHNTSVDRQPAGGGQGCSTGPLSDLCRRGRPLERGGRGHASKTRGKGSSPPLPYATKSKGKGVGWRAHQPTVAAASRSRCLTGLDGRASSASHTSLCVEPPWGGVPTTRPAAAPEAGAGDGVGPAARPGAATAAAAPPHVSRAGSEGPAAWDPAPRGPRADPSPSGAPIALMMSQPSMVFGNGTGGMNVDKRCEFDLGRRGDEPHHERVWRVGELVTAWRCPPNNRNLTPPPTTPAKTVPLTHMVMVRPPPPPPRPPTHPPPATPPPPQRCRGGGGGGVCVW